LTRGDGTQFTVADQVAPSMNLFANLFQSMELRINDKTISRIPNYVGQIEALENRLNKSKAQLDGIMGSTNFMQSDFSERQAQICSDGVQLSTNPTTKSSTPIIGLVDDLGVPLVALHTFAYASAVGIVTFDIGAAGGGNPVPNVSQIFKSGDVITFTSAGNEGKILTVINGIDALNIQCQTGSVNIGTAPLNAVLASRNRANSNSRNIKEFELCWTPCLSLFKINHAMPSGKYELILIPYPSAVYQLQSIESRNPVNFKNSVTDPSLITGLATDVRFNVVDMYLYCNTVEGPRADNMSYLLDLNQTSCQQETVKNNSFSQKNYDVSPATFALTIAFQDGRCINDTRVSSSLFKCFSDTYDQDRELTLNRLFVSYSGQNRPNPDADPTFNIGTDRTVQRYVETMIENGAYFDHGGAETIEDFHKRGSYYYFAFSRDGTDRSTRVVVHSGFSNAFGTILTNTNTNCLLFAHSKQIGKITIQDGMVTDVQVEDS
jgi:hypothetical protein